MTVVAVAALAAALALVAVVGIGQRHTNQDRAAVERAAALHFDTAAVRVDVGARQVTIIRPDGSACRALWDGPAQDPVFGEPLCP